MASTGGRTGGTGPMSTLSRSARWRGWRFTCSGGAAAPSLSGHGVEDARYLERIGFQSLAPGDRDMMSPRWASFPGGKRRSRARAAVPALVAILPLCMPMSAPPAAAREIAPDQELISLTALVRDVFDDRGLQGAVIQLDGVVTRYVTGEDGRAEMQLPAGTYLLTVRKGGYAELVGDLQVFEPGEFTLDMERVRDVDMRVPPKLLVRVVDGRSGEAIEGVRVSLEEGGTRMTDQQGRTEFTDLQPGVARVGVEMIGYAQRTEPVALHPDRTTSVVVAMSPRAIELEPIVVNVRSPRLERWGVYDRLDRGEPRRVLTRRMIDQRAVGRLSDAFYAVPGVRVRHRSISSTRLVARANCTLSVYVDGFRWGTNIDAVPPDWVELAEVYWGLSTPIEYTGMRGGGCGAVLIWTRLGAA
ncbi:MAG: TonB-dependent receptor plug domain-containing protein [Gemmatimonadetes bacterium]|nr:TonB-dependent receptor plug domain-containing protein [Gemmatimonadota bacterium]MYB99250.1 TonB-dependent receptor plug domain-containing protein [Gemmatimonadota bacterium]MYI46685.1 TonB-dependent receptor plug domain-containing protein [Gemmatimonadota bacterium]